MKQWVVKLLEQFDLDWNNSGDKSQTPPDISEDRATLLYIIDTYNKNLIEIDKHPVRKIREVLDEFSKALLNPKNPQTEKVLFRLRQFFSSYRIDEYTYIQKTFDDFKGIIWDFADQLGDDVKFEQAADSEVQTSLNQLREAVESNSIDDLRTKSREFIDFYVEQQTKKEERRTERMSQIQKNLNTVKKKLFQVNETVKRDHLTGAHNRRSFDEHINEVTNNFKLTQSSVTLILLDIDNFKKVNDIFGHDTGDLVIKECVRFLRESFQNQHDFVARIGGEEFAVVLGDARDHEVAMRAEQALERIRQEVIIQNNAQIRFTVSMGIAQLAEGETTNQWIKRADNALYESKNNGRNQITVASQPKSTENVA